MPISTTANLNGSMELPGTSRMYTTSGSSDTDGDGDEYQGEFIYDDVHNINDNQTHAATVQQGRVSYLQH